MGARELDNEKQLNKETETKKFKKEGLDERCRSVGGKQVEAKEKGTSREENGKKREQKGRTNTQRVSVDKIARNTLTSSSCRDDSIVLYSCNAVAHLDDS